MRQELHERLCLSGGDVQTELRQAWRDAVKLELEKILGPHFAFRKRNTGKYQCYPLSGGLDFELFLLHLDEESLQCKIHRTHYPPVLNLAGRDLQKELAAIDRAIWDLLIYKAIKIASQKWSYTDLIGDLTNDT